MAGASTEVLSVGTKKRRTTAWRYLKRYWVLYLIAVPGIIDMVVFRYWPMYGIVIAFKDYNIRLGMLRSPWAGFKHFSLLIGDAYFYRVLANTLLINVYNIVIGFTFIVFLALMINEIRVRWLKSTIQTMVYLPHFVSWVVFAGLVMTVLEPSRNGVINSIVMAAGGDPIRFLTRNSYFKAILVISGMVKEAGFATIIFLAALASVNPALIESAQIDGAHRGHLIWHIYLPRIGPTVAVLLILRIASLFSSNFDQVYNLYNPAVYDSGDVLSTYIYRFGLTQGQFEMGTALGLVFSILGLGLVIAANKVISKLNVMGIF